MNSHEFPWILYTTHEFTLYFRYISMVDLFVSSLLMNPSCDYVIISYMCSFVDWRHGVARHKINPLVHMPSFPSSAICSQSRSRMQHVVVQNIQPMCPYKIPRCKMFGQQDDLPLKKAWHWFATNKPRMGLTAAVRHSIYSICRSTEQQYTYLPWPRPCLAQLEQRALWSEITLHNLRRIPAIYRPHAKAHAAVACMAPVVTWTL